MSDQPTFIASFDKRSLLLFAALTMGASTAPWAQSAAAAMKDQKALMALFAQADTNGDKALNPEEAKAIPELGKRFGEADANGDGAVSEAEFIASMAPAAK